MIAAQEEPATRKHAASLMSMLQILGFASTDCNRKRALPKSHQRDFHFSVENDPVLIEALVELLLQEMAGIEFGDEAVRGRVGVALQESLSNALYHGNLEISSSLRQDDERRFFAVATERRSLGPYQERRVHVDATIDRDSATFVIRDEGPGFDVSQLDRPIDPEDLMRIGGRGLLLIRTFMDEVRHNAIGNEITLVKRSGR